MADSLHDLMNRHSGPGHIRWIGVRPARRAPVLLRTSAHVSLAGLDGDRRQRPGKRALTLIQWEHLSVIAALSGHASVDPSDLRRNIAVAGINLAALRDRTVRIGAAVIRITAPCHPCSRMEEALGPGGYNAMRGHGGMTAEILEPGDVAIEDRVVPVA